MKNPALLPAALGLALAILGCQADGSEEPQSSEPSPNAAILPAPLTSGAELPGGGLSPEDAGDARAALQDAGPPIPIEVRDDESLPVDALSARDASGLELQAFWRWRDPASPSAVAEAGADALRAARNAGALSVSIQVTNSGRLRYRLTSDAFILPAETELRARRDMYGHVLVWPSENAYRILPPGKLRALFEEGRADATPLVQAKVRAVGSGSAAGLSTERTELSAPSGKLMLEQTTLAGAGPGGQLLCRLLLEVIAVQPTNEACQDDRVPLRAEFRWLKGGQITFEVTALVRRMDLSLSDLAIWPTGAELRIGELPVVRSGIVLSETLLATLHRQPAKSPEKTTKHDLVLINRTHLPRYLLLDGVAVGWVRPRGETPVRGLLAGRYSGSWRDFLGTEVTAASPVQVPGRLVVGPASDDAKGPQSPARPPSP
jgi:hypothetical protein